MRNPSAEISARYADPYAGLEATCEESKPGAIPPQAGNGVEVWKLPMRNPSVTAGWALSAQNSVWKLPIRNPSRRAEASSWPKSPHLEATYEESKPEKPLPPHVPLLVWKLPMRNPSDEARFTTARTYPVWMLPMRNPSS